MCYQAHRAGVGKYMAPSGGGSEKRKLEEDANEVAPSATKQKAAKPGGFGDFSSW